MLSLSRAASVVLTSAALAAATAGCTDSGAHPAAPSASASKHVLSSTKVCSGLFANAEGAPLTELLESTAFTEDRESLTIESPGETAGHMRSEKKTKVVHYLCLTYASPYQPAKYVRIAADWYPYDIGKDADATNRGSSVFALSSGLHAYAEDHWAIIGFPCRVGIGKNPHTSVRVVAETQQDPAPSTRPEHREELTRAGAAAAARLASALGCLKESGLPDPVGELTAVPQT
jgi:hypothetical protein